MNGGKWTLEGRPNEQIFKDHHNQICGQVTLSILVQSLHPCCLCVVIAISGIGLVSDVTNSLPVGWCEKIVAISFWLKFQNSRPSVLPGGCLNIKMSSYQYKDPHVKDKTVS